MTDDDDDPLCDVWGDCEPCQEQQHLVIADCQFCGGQRYHVNGRWMTWTRSIEAYVEDYGITGNTLGQIWSDELPDDYAYD